MQTQMPKHLVLDVGCGTGESLNEELRIREARGIVSQEVRLVGIDIDLEALRTAKGLYPGFSFVCARGEQLPFQMAAFKVAVSRVAIPYMDVPVTLRELRRVLMVGGELRIKLHPLSYTWSELVAELQSGSLRQRIQNLLYRLYVIMNGIALHFAGFNFRFPLKNRCESFQTKRGIERALVAAGFHTVDTSCWVTTIVRPHAGNCRATANR
jgi:ubiquinone/menaquinone biosynthesis C-methylase UbiE